MLTSLVNGSTRRAYQSRWHVSEQKKSDGELARSAPQTAQGSVIALTSHVHVHLGR